MRHSKLLACALTATMLTACTEPNGAPGRGVMNDGNLNKSDVGTAAGALAGGVIGYQFGGGVGSVLATAGGALLGGMLGNMVGKSLDDADLASYNQASQRAMETGKTNSWKNTHNGNSGTIYPNKRYTNADGQYCREYTQTIIVEGKSHKGHGTACREANGTWQIVE